MKTIIKLAKQRTNLPILNTIKVDNGIAYATDCDLIIAQPTTLANGLYNSALLPSDLDISGFPETIFTHQYYEEHYGVVPMSLEQIETIQPFQSREETRYYICGIAFYQNQIAATDGHTCHVIPNQIKIEHPLFNKGAIVPSYAIKLAIALMKEAKQKACALTFYKHSVKIQVGESYVESKYIDNESYPDFKRFIPTNEGQTTPHVQSTYKPIIKRMKELGKAYGVGKFWYGLKFKNGECTALFNTHYETFSNLTQFTHDFGFNVELLERIPDGEMVYTDATNPVRINHPNGSISVIMPMRT